MEVRVTNQNPRSSQDDPFPVARVRVYPASDEIRKYIIHPLTRMRFTASMSESVEWPFDQFTKRRLKDGVVLLEPAIQPEPPSSKGE